MATPALEAGSLTKLPQVCPQTPNSEGGMFWSRTMISQSESGLIIDLLPSQTAAVKLAALG